MKPNYNTIASPLRDYLTRIMNCRAFDDFYLAGGTALSLQLGHRISVDIDLFTAKEYGSLDTAGIKRALSSIFKKVINIENLDERQMVYTLFIGDEDNIVKLDLCYDECPIFPILSVDKIRMLSDKDIAAMKLLAIITGNRVKDFWDIHELMQKYSLESMIEWSIQRNPYTVNRQEILDAFEKVWDFPEQQDIICLRHKLWPFVADELYTASKALRARCEGE